MTHWKKLRNKTYLGSWDFEPNEVKQVTISEVSLQNIKGFFNGRLNESEETVVYFKEQKPMIFNNENSERTEKILGTFHIEEWTGKTIFLHVEEVRVKAEWTTGVRVTNDLTPSHPKWAGAKKAIAEKTATIQDVKKKYTLTAANEKLLKDA